MMILVGPDVVVAGKVMRLDTHVGELRDFSKETGIALGYYIFIFVPEIEHVAQQVDGSRLLLDAIEKANQSAFLHALVRNG